MKISLHIIKEKLCVRFNKLDPTVKINKIFKIEMFFIFERQMPPHDLQQNKIFHF